MRTQFQKLLVKEMGRKDFLIYSGTVILTVIGVKGLSRALLQENYKQNSSGYGASSYGSKTIKK